MLSILVTLGKQKEFMRRYRNKQPKHPLRETKKKAD